MAVNYVKFYRGSQQAFDKITKKDSDVLYFITSSDSKRGSLYLGDKLIAGNIDALSDLSDILLTEVKDRQLLVYNAEKEKWENKNVVDAINVMKGPDDQNQGAAGLVPAPGIGQQKLFLRGDGTWASPELSGGEVISETLTYEVTVNTFSYEDHVAALNAASAKDSLVRGSIGIVKTLIAADKYQYTAYIYNGTQWAAMDGNYSSDSIYFDSDILITAPVGVITQDKINEGSGSVVFSAKNKNVTEVFASLFAEEKMPTIDFPSIELVASGMDGEVGAEFTLPTAVFKIVDVGSYSYGSVDANGNKYEANDTGVVFKAGNVVLTQNGNIIKNNIDLTTGDTMTITATGDNTFTDGDTSFTFVANATYTGNPDRIPITNIGNSADSLKITSLAIDPLSKTVYFRGYRKAFYGSNITPVELNSDNIRNLSGSKRADINLHVCEIEEGARQVIIAVPSNKVVQSVEDEGAFNTNIISEFIVTENVMVEGANGKLPMAYDIYTYNPKTALGKNTYAILIKNKM